VKGLLCASGCAAVRRASAAARLAASCGKSVSSATGRSSNASRTASPSPGTSPTRPGLPEWRDSASGIDTTRRPASARRAKNGQSVAADEPEHAVLVLEQAHGAGIAEEELNGRPIVGGAGGGGDDVGVRRGLRGEECVQQRVVRLVVLVEEHDPAGLRAGEAGSP
jgi:hypothetical protein